MSPKNKRVMNTNRDIPPREDGEYHLAKKQ